MNPTVRTFRSRFPGVCPICRRTIPVGEVIGAWGGGRYAHAACIRAEVPEAVAPKKKAAPPPPARTRPRRASASSGPPRKVTGQEETSAGLRWPALWVPVEGGASVLLPPQRTAEPDLAFLRKACGVTGRVRDGPRRSWIVERREADAVLAGMRERFGAGALTLVVDVRTSGPCYASCVRGKVGNALQCECPCGGINHGGLNAAGWRRVSLLERSDGVQRHVWTV